MAQGLPRATRDNLEKCRSAAVAAVDAYNRPGPRFRTAHYIILIVVAWTALFHAIFYKKRIKPWFKRKGSNPRGDRYLRVDGDPRHWDLMECLRKFYGSENPAERKVYRLGDLSSAWAQAGMRWLGFRVGGAVGTAVVASALWGLSAWRLGASTSADVRPWALDKWRDSEVRHACGAIE